MPQPVNKSEVAAAYDRWAETYDTDFNHTRSLAAEVLRRVDLQVDGREVIEIGCGTGHNTEWLAHAASRVVALDFSEGMLLRAKARVHRPSIRFLQHDVRTPWPLPGASSDLLIAMLVLEHVEQLKPFFAEAARTLRVDGELFLCELHPTRQLLGKQAEFRDAKTGELHRVPAFLHETEDYIKSALSSGFEILSKTDCYDSDAQADAPPRLLSLHLRLTQ